jgi:ferredoxin-NADP reductase
MDGHLIRAGMIADQTLSFVIELDEPLGFRAGQSCDVIINKPLYADDKGAMRTFTIASAPGEDPRLTFATRHTGTAFKRTIAAAPPDLRVEVDGPWGDFVLHDDSSRPAVFLAGGIGITPFHSMIADAIERRLPHDITLFYSNRNAADAAFLDELNAWDQAHAHFRLVATMTGESPAESARRGRITRELIAEHIGADARPIYYSAGTEAFVSAMRAALTALGVAEQDIRTDEFPGY